MRLWEKCFHFNSYALYNSSAKNVDQLTRGRGTKYFKFTQLDLSSVLAINNNKSAPNRCITCDIPRLIIT